MTKIYHKAFATSFIDRERDEALGLRMAALNFVGPQHLDIPACFHDEKAWLLAMKELHKINSYKVLHARDGLAGLNNLDEGSNVGMKEKYASSHEQQVYIDHSSKLQGRKDLSFPH